MRRRRWLWVSLLAWAGVWAFWLASTRRFHPTFALAVIVTTSLVAAYAAAAYVNHLVLIPRLRRTGERSRYAARLAAVMVALTASALAIIRLSYRALWGPDADPYGAYRHFAIDLFGMAVHLAAAWVVVLVARSALDRTRPSDAADAARRDPQLGPGILPPPPGDSGNA